MKKVPAQASFPRHFRFCQLQSKGDPTGKGPEAARTTLLLCNCVQMLESGEERRFFPNKLTEDPDCACCVSCCPYRVFVKYLSLIPDPYGEQVTKKNEKKRVFRSVTARNTTFGRTFMNECAGKHNLAKCMKFINSKLSIENQVFHKALLLSLLIIGVFLDSSWQEMYRTWITPYIRNQHH